MKEDQTNPPVDEIQVQKIAMQPGYDTETGQWGYGYSPDNGVHFFVLNSIYGRKFRQEDADRIWPFLKGKVRSVLSLSWDDIQDKPVVVTPEQLEQRLAKLNIPTTMSWNQITDKPAIATQNDLKKIELTPGPAGKDGNDGQPGKDGKSAYQLAVDNGFQGSETEWLASLKGGKGDKGDPGTPGKDGTNGKSAYQLAVDAGFTGTEQEWLSSLKGPKGDTGNTGSPGKDGRDGKDGTSGKNGVDGITPHIDASTGHWFLGSQDTGVTAQGPAGKDATSTIDDQDLFTSKKPSDYSDGIFREVKYISSLNIDRSNLYSTAQDGNRVFLTTKVYHSYARQTAEVFDGQRPITFIRNGFGSSWYNWEVVTTW